MSEKSSNSQKPIDRRKMLKGTLAVGGAVTAAAFLDGKWLKSIVKTGVLPVHAQASVCAEYTFVPLFTLIEEFAFELGVVVLPDPPTPPDGPISFEIMAVDNMTLNPGVSTIGSGTLSGGTATFPGSFTFGDVEEDASITIKWTFTGCDYTQIYGPEALRPT